ncbi:chorismate mutase [Candidatus Uhrbacteria bacterium]|nr:chorismate mutase [Candidatus Uhrbacteria bacterium]
MNQGKKIGVSGDQGSFSEEAGTLYANREGLDPDIAYCTDMEGVLSALENETIELGVFPVVNSRGGLVQMAFEAMGRHLFTLVDEVVLEVHQCLLTMPGMVKNTVTAIATHPQAIAQCEQYIKTELPHAQLIPWEDTAKAARDLRDGKLQPTTAVIAPARAATLYGLQILEKSIQDQHPNLTTFIVVKRYDHY